MRFSLRVAGVSVALLGLLAGVVGCGSAKPKGSAPVASASATSPSLTTPVPPDRAAKAPVGTGDFPEEPVRGLTPIDRGSHEEALGAVRAGHLPQAKRALGRLAAAYPNEAVLVEQYNVVAARIEARQDAAKRQLEAARLRALPIPPFAYTLVRPAANGSAAVPKLVERSNKKNATADDEKWFASNDLRLPEYFVPPVTDFLFAGIVKALDDAIDRIVARVSATEVRRTFDGFRYTEFEPSGRFSAEPLPVSVPLAYGTIPLARVIDSSPYVVAIYGTNVVAVFERDFKLAGLFDFTNYLHPPASKKSNHVVGQATLTTDQATTHANLTVAVQSIVVPLTFALARDGVLYVTHSNLGYAKDSAGQNAYVSAIDLASGELAWRSAPLVANIRNFALVGGGVVCGYGYTAEPDFVFVLDRATGAVKQKIPVRSGPDYVVAKESRVFIRAYDTDYVFDVR